MPIIIACILLSAGEGLLFAQTTCKLESHPLFGIEGQPYLECYRRDSVTVSGIIIPRPFAPAWTRTFATGEDERVVIIWDNGWKYLDAWFLEPDGDLWKLAGISRLNLKDNTPLGSTELDKPLLPANNLLRPSYYDSTFSCVDRSFGLIRYFSLDYDSRKLEQDSVRRIGLVNGRPLHSVYLYGDADGGGRGIAVMRSSKLIWEWLPLDEQADIEFSTRNHAVIYHYIPGDVVPVAKDSVCNSFVMLDPVKGRMMRFTTRYGQHPPAEPFADKGPWLTASCPMPRESWVGEEIKLPIRRVIGYSVTNVHRPLNVDREGRLWYSPADSKVLFVLQEAYFDQLAYKETDPGERRTISLPSNFQLPREGVIGLDGSIPGLLTVISLNGLESFAVLEN